MANAKLERLMNLLAALLQTPVPLSAAELRERIGGYGDDDVAFHQQFSRDKKDLRHMGVPIRLEPVPGSEPPVDGYRVDPDEYYLPDPELDADELAALHLATRLVAVGATNDPTSLFKLGGIAGDVDAARPPLATVPHDPNLGVLFDTINRRRIAGFDYRGRSRRLVARALGFQHGFWYVTGWDVDVAQDRVYRLDRMESTVRDVGAASEPPEGSARLEALQPWRVGGTDVVTTKILVDRIAVPMVTARIGEDRIIEVTDEGAAVMRLDVANPEGFRSWLLEFGSGVEVLEPVEFREAMISWLDQFTAEAP